MWSWNQCVLIVSRQSPGTGLILPSSVGDPAFGSVASLLMVENPASTIGQW